MRLKFNKRGGSYSVTILVFLVLFLTGYTLMMYKIGSGNISENMQKLEYITSLNLRIDEYNFLTQLSFEQAIVRAYKEYLSTNTKKEGDYILRENRVTDNFETGMENLIRVYLNEEMNKYFTEDQKKDILNQESSVLSISYKEQPSLKVEPIEIELKDNEGKINAKYRNSIYVFTDLEKLGLNDIRKIEQTFDKCNIVSELTAKECFSVGFKGIKIDKTVISQEEIKIYFSSGINYIFEKNKEEKIQFILTKKITSAKI